MLKQRIELWTGREDFKRKVRAVQYDSARTLECVVMDATLPEGAMAHFFAAKPSGKKVYLDCTVTGNTVSVELPDQALAETGSIPCQIEIFDKSEKRISSFEFILDVKKTLITDAAIESTDAVTTLKKYVDAAKGSAEAAKKSETAAGSAKDGAVSAKTAAEDAKSKAETAQGKAETAKTGAEAAQKAAQDAQTAAETAQKGAGESAAKAAACATQAENWTNQSKSWAVGEGYPDRSDQAKDNSKFYAGQAKASADAAQALSDRLTEIAGGDVVLHKEIGAPGGAASLDGGGKVPDAQLGISDRTVAFEEAAAQENIASGEKISTLFGKIKKWLSGLPSSLAAKVSKAGDTMSGDLTLSGAERHIKYSSGVYSGKTISFYKGTDAGSDIVIGDGALAIFGGGESAHSLYTSGAVKPATNQEETHITADTAVYVHTNCNAIANRKTFTFGADGSLTAPTGFKGNAATAAKLQTAHKINGQAFDGTKDITVVDGSKLPLAGGTMTGDLTLSGTPRAIKFASGKRNGSPIRFFAGDASGSGIVIGDGGRTIIGAGESTDALHTALSTSEGDENMHIGGDSSVFVYTACNSIANRKTFIFGTDGKLNTPAGITQSSDRRLKTDINPIPEEQIEAFKNLSPKAYTLKSSGKPGIGLIAQEVQGTTLEAALVSKGDNGMLSIDYTNPHGLEIAVIQSLIEQVETLQTEISELKAHIKG